jgi:hypothetical protein
MRADDPAVFLLDDSRLKVFADNFTQGLFETAEPIRASVKNDPNQEKHRMIYPEYKQLTFERHENGVLLITLNRPEKYNAVDEGMHGELARVWTDISADPRTRVAVVTGAGKAFSAGGDLEMVQRIAGPIFDQSASYEMLSFMGPDVVEVAASLREKRPPVSLPRLGPPPGLGQNSQKG